jgi:hypothetical protein
MWKMGYLELFKDAIASLEPVVQNKQDCPEDSGSDRISMSSVTLKNDIQPEITNQTSQGDCL